MQHNAKDNLQGHATPFTLVKTLMDCMQINVGRMSVEPYNTLYVFTRISITNQTMVFIILVMYVLYQC